MADGKPTHPTEMMAAESGSSSSSKKRRLSTASQGDAAAAADAAAAPPAPVVARDDPYVPIFRLKNHFEETMKTNCSPLLSSWEKYREMLPVRESDSKVRYIAACPYWAREEEVTNMAKSLEKPAVSQRVALPYISAPSHSGKTASVLMGFLNSCESRREGRFTHYFYLAFHNNGGKHFCYGEDPNHERSLSKDCRRNQGADFAFQCVDFLLKEGPLTQAQRFDRDVKPEGLPDAKNTADKIDALLNEKIPGENCRILLHVDEHRRMNDDECFRRGALECLANCARVVCIVTYTDIPSEIDAAKSSAVCRCPVLKPELDMAKVFTKIPELNILSLLTDKNQKRIWATLVFKLARHIRPIMLPIHLGMETEFLKKFKAKREKGDIGGCLELCDSRIVTGPARPQKRAAELLAGIVDEELGKFDFQIIELTATNERITGALDGLLRVHDPEYRVYAHGRQRFINVLNEAKATDDLLAATPLEAAFSWSLSCIACVGGELKFSPNFVFELAPVRLVADRLFARDTVDTVKASTAITKNSVLYYADEHVRGADDCSQFSHPLCNMWFLSGNDELVLIDVTGGAIHADAKMEKFRQFLASEAAKKLPGATKFGIVLAPADAGKSIEDTTNNVNVCAVKGKDARLLLGGLAQCWQWFCLDSYVGEETSNKKPKAKDTVSMDAKED